jgi:hypothetical protein
MAYYENGRMKMSSRLVTSITALIEDMVDKAKEANLG